MIGLGSNENNYNLTTKDNSTNKTATHWLRQIS